MIQNTHLDSIRLNALEFAEVLKRLNNGQDTLKCQPRTLLRRLERKSKLVADSAVIVEYLREKGIPDSKIFSK